LQNLKKLNWLNLVGSRRVAGGAMEAIASPNSESCTKTFRGNQAFDV